MQSREFHVEKYSDKYTNIVNFRLQMQSIVEFGIQKKYLYFRIDIVYIFIDYPFETSAHMKIERKRIE